PSTVISPLSLHDALPIFADFNEALRVLLNDRKKLTGFMLDDIVEPVLNGAVDANGRPIWIESPLTIDENAVTRQGRLLGRPAGEDRKSTRLNSSHVKISY